MKISLFLIILTPFLFPGSVLAQVPASYTYYIHQDYLGSVVAVTDEAGNSVEQNKYLPFGKEAAVNSAIGDRVERGYTGQIKDQSTSLMYYNARYYDPTLSRFISPDSIADSINRYAYVKGNPVSATDPTGNRLLDDDYGGIFDYWKYKDPVLVSMAYVGRLAYETLGKISTGKFYSDREFFGSGLFRPIPSDILEEGRYLKPGIEIASSKGEYLFSTEIPEKVKAAEKAARSLIPEYLINARYIIALEDPTPSFASYTLSHTSQPGAIISSNYTFSFTPNQLIREFVHEYAHRFELLPSDYGSPTGEQKRIIDIVADIVSTNTIVNVDPDTGGLSLPLTFIPEDAHSLKNWPEFLADSFAAYSCPVCFYEHQGYEFPIFASDFSELKSFYDYLTGK